MNNLFVDLSDKPDTFWIELLPTSYVTAPRIVARTHNKHIDISIDYYNGLTKMYKSIKAPLDCDIEFEKQQLKDSVIKDITKITDTFTISKKDLTPDIIKKFRWCQPLIEFCENEVPIDPYFLGLWLGDGHSSCVNLTSIDNILIDYWSNYAKINNLNVSSTNPKVRVSEVKDGEAGNVCSYRIGSPKNISHNPVLIEFQKLNLIKNKHIPEIYLHNSIEIRLKVLAGLIDTDGYLHSNRYEIIQKSKKLSDDIITLANSLGFFTTMGIKKAYASNTELKTVRDYYRIYITVNQINPEIPVLLERKKIKSILNFNNPKILINNNQLCNRIVWSEQLDTLLKESVERYRSPKGKNLIPWTLIVNEVKEFYGCSPGALRVRFKNF